MRDDSTKARGEPKGTRRIAITARLDCSGMRRRLGRRMNDMCDKMAMAIRLEQFRVRIRNPFDTGSTAAVTAGP
jgi:hypothetical protein